MKRCHGLASRRGAFAVLILLALSAPLPAPRAGVSEADASRLDSIERPAFSDHGEAGFALVRLAGPFEFPWSIAVLPDDTVLVTERPGRLRLVVAGRLRDEPVDGVPPLLTEAHAGLLDVVPDPAFADNRVIYLSYTHGVPEAVTLRILRARFDGASLTGGEVIFESRPAPGVVQLGGRLAFGADGMLYLTLGDRFEGHRAQDLRDHSGSIIRIRPDGAIPADNPLIDLPEALPDIYSYGHRNPQGLAVEPGSGRLWSHEHGPQGGDELNLIEAGRNYGWPLASHGRDYDDSPIDTFAPGTTPPVHHWTPAIAPSGLAFYDADALPAWRQHALVGSLAAQRLLLLDLSGPVVTESILIDGEIGRIRDVRVGPDGLVYLVTDEAQGFLYRLEPIIEQSARGRPAG